MNPQQPYQTPRPGSEYDFFMNPGQAPKPSPMGKLNSSSLVNRLLIVVGGLFILMIVFWIFLSIFSGGDSNKTNLITVVQYQTELVRIAGQASLSGVSQSSQSTKNLAQSVNLSVTSEKSELLKLMAAHGIKVNPKVMVLKHNPQTDTTLASAIAASNFDTTFKGVMRTQLTNYQTALKTAFTHAKDANEKQILSDDYDASVLMLKQLGDPAQ